MARSKVTVNTTTADQSVVVPANHIAVVMAIDERPSKSGKMILITTSNGNQETETEYKGRPVVVNANIAFYPTDKA